MVKIRFFFLAAAALMLPTVAAAQTSAAGTDLLRQERDRQRNEAELASRMAEMHTLEQRIRLATERDKIIVGEPRLSGEERARVLDSRKIDLGELEGYGQFLGQPKTGVFKLFPDFGCMSKKVLRISGDCAHFVPLSSSFTFRTNGYGDEVYHDLRFEGSQLVSNSFFSQGILVSLGDTPIEGVDLNVPAVKFLTEYQPDTDAKSAAQHAREFQKGIESSGFVYADSADLAENTTYAIRLIAYRLENGLQPLSLDLPMNVMMFHSLAVDKRDDLIVAFRVLKKDENGGVPVVWKELRRADAPKIRFAKGEALRDFRPIRKETK